MLPAKQQIVPGAQNRLPSHCPFVQTSLIVQMLRSSQGVLLGRVWVTQAPVAGLQVLVWQGLVGAGQVFSEPVVQVPVAGSQTPAVWHRLLAEHTTGLRPVQTPDWQVSVWVQRLPSSQAVSSGTARGSHCPVLESQTLTRQGSAEVGQVTPMQGSRQQVFPTLQQTVPASLVQIFSGRQQTFAPLSWVEHTLPVPQHSELRPWASAPHGSCPAGQHSSLPGALTQLSPALQQIICPVTSVQGFGHVQVHVVGSRTWGAGQLATQALVAEQTSCQSPGQVPH